MDFPLRRVFEKLGCDCSVFDSCEVKKLLVPVYFKMFESCLYLKKKNTALSYCLH